MVFLYRNPLEVGRSLISRPPAWLRAAEPPPEDAIREHLLACTGAVTEHGADLVLYHQHIASGDAVRWLYAHLGLELGDDLFRRMARCRDTHTRTGEPYDPRASRSAEPLPGRRRRALDRVPELIEFKLRHPPYMHDTRGQVSGVDPADPSGRPFCLAAKDCGLDWPPALRSWATWTAVLSRTPLHCLVTRREQYFVWTPRNVPPPADYVTTSRWVMMRFAEYRERGDAYIVDCVPEALLGRLPDLAGAARRSVGGAVDLRGDGDIAMRVSHEGALTGLHYDANSVFLFQVLGRKRIILFPPSELSHLAPYPCDHFMARRCLVNFENSHPELFPEFDPSRAVERVLGPGEMTYIPGYWAHFVVTEEDSLTLGIRAKYPELTLQTAPAELVRAAESCRGEAKGYPLSPDSRFVAQARGVVRRCAAVHGEAAAAAPWLEMWLDTLDPDWDDVCVLATSTGLAPVVHDVLASCPRVPAGALAELKDAYRVSALTSAPVLQACVEAVGALRRRDIDALVLDEVAAAAGLYRNVALRPVTGVDLLVHPADETEARSILAQGPSVRLHVELFGCAESLEWAWETARQRELGETAMHVLGDEAQLLRLASEIRRDGSGWLRQNDFALLLRARAAQLDWRALYDGARRTGLERTLRHALVESVETFGLSFRLVGADPGSTRSVERDQSLRHELLDKRADLRLTRLDSVARAEEITERLEREGPLPEQEPDTAAHLVEPDTLTRLVAPDEDVAVDGRAQRAAGAEDAGRRGHAGKVTAAPSAGQWAAVASNQRYLFIHVPKTAGQAMYAALGQEVQAHRPLRKHQPPPSPQCFVFAFVRHPFDRAVSLYTWFRQLHERPDIRRALAHEAVGELARHFSCAAFWEQVDIRRLRRSTPMFREQYWFLRGPRSVDFIGRYERLEADWAVVARIIGAPAQLDSRNTSRRGPEDELTEAARARIRELYANDFARFYP